MPTFAVYYRYADQPALLAEHRPAHRAYLSKLAEAGHLLGAGRFADAGPQAALLVFCADTPDDVHAWLDDDPFQSQGLVQTRDVRHWPVVIGPWQHHQRG
jgi:uncharacterized protein YciI